MKNEALQKSRDLSLEAGRIISLLKREFVLPDGGLAIDKNKGELVPYHVYHDLGDFVPFLLYFGEKEFVDEQVRLYAHAAPGGVLVSEFPAARFVRGLSKSYEYTDLLLGLAAYKGASSNDDANSLLVSTADAAVRMFHLSEESRSFYFHPLGMALPIIDTKISTLIELFAYLDELYPRKQYLAYANRIYESLERVPFYVRYGLFPDFAFVGALRLLPSWGRSFSGGDFHKPTANALFAFLELYKKTKSERVFSSIQRSVSSVKKYMQIDGGGIAARFQSGNAIGPAHLGASFSTIDFLCDLYKETSEDSYIHFAKEIGDYWITLQAKTGLFPKHSKSMHSFVDSETDMFVALCKLWELTGSEVYRASASRCLDGLRTFHGAHDYPVSVHIETGAVINQNQRTKFLCLFLKALILEIEYGQGNRIYSDPELFELLKDR